MCAGFSGTVEYRHASFWIGISMCHGAHFPIKKISYIIFYFVEGKKKVSNSTLGSASNIEYVSKVFGNRYVTNIIMMMSNQYTPVSVLGFHLKVT